MTLIISTPQKVYAAQAQGINATWNILMEEVFIWIPKIGIVSLVFGGIEMGIATINEDANQRTRATRFMASGALIISLCEILKPFLV